MTKIVAKKIQFSKTSKYSPYWGLLILLTFVSLSWVLFSLTSGISKHADKTQISEYTADPLAIEIDTNYQVAPEKVTENQTTPEPSLSDVLGAKDCGQFKFYYDDQLSCAQADISNTACDQDVLDENEDPNGVTGICYRPGVIMKVTRVTYPSENFYGTLIEGTKGKYTEYAESEMIGIARDPETGGQVALDFYNFQRGGEINGSGYKAENSDRNTILKNLSPATSGYTEIPSASDAVAYVDIKSKQEVPVMLLYKLATKFAEGEYNRGFAMLFENMFRALKGGNSPNTANSSYKYTGGNPITSPVNKMPNRSFDRDECRVQEETLNVVKTYAKNSQEVGELGCMEPIIASHEVDLEENSTFDWFKCFINPTPEECEYRLISSIYVDAPWGSAYKCNDETCSTQVADLRVTFAMSPLNPLINFDETVKNNSNPTLKPSYVKTPCEISYVDESKTIGKSGKATVYCIYEVPQTKYYLSWEAESMPGIFPDMSTPANYEKMLEQAKKSHLGTLGVEVN